MTIARAFWILTLISSTGDLPLAYAEHAETQPLTLLDFSRADDSEWRVINDGVMGGLSQSQIQRTDHESGVFAGTLSLENNGGFASVRALVGNLDLSRYRGLEIRVRGDGRTYQLRLRTADGVDGVAYRAFFETDNGSWTTTFLSFHEFKATFRGRLLPDAAPLDTSNIRQISFLLADNQPGPFSLEIDLVRAM